MNGGSGRGGKAGRSTGRGGGALGVNLRCDRERERGRSMLEHELRRWYGMRLAMPLLLLVKKHKSDGTECAAGKQTPLGSTEYPVWKQTPVGSTERPVWHQTPLRSTHCTVGKQMTVGQRQSGQLSAHTGSKLVFPSVPQCILRVPQRGVWWPWRPLPHCVPLWFTREYVLTSWAGDTSGHTHRSAPNRPSWSKYHFRTPPVPPRTSP